MFFEDKDFGSTLLENPLMVESQAIKMLEERLGGKYRLADPNSPFNHLIEFATSINSITTLKYEDAYRRLYTRRAQTMDDLYRHMTDYDYLNLFSSPATTKVELVLNKDYLLNQALEENEMYYRVDIPRQTIFTLGKLSFGIHYPIIIRIVKVTGTIIVTYDTSVTNPLHQLAGNMIESGATPKGQVEHFTEEYSGLSIIKLQIPVFQFSRSQWTEDLVSPIGFSKTYSFNDKFYAVRIFNVDGTKKTEMSQSLSPTTYDPSVPTAKITVNRDTSTFTVDIPQVYFSNKQMGRKLYMELYTTAGALDINLGQVALNTSNVNFNLNAKDVSKYSAPLKYSVTIGLRLPNSKVIGGSDGFGFEELRDRVINQNFYKSVPLTPSDLEKYFQDNGFIAEKLRDGITDRVFACYKVLQDGEGSSHATTMNDIVLTKESVSKVNTIVEGMDQSITILPTTIYKFSPENQQSYPLTTSERNDLFNLNRDDLCHVLNSSTYTMSPFHLRVDMTDRHPVAKTFNLHLPKVENFVFVKENLSIASTMVAYAFSIVKRKPDNGYTLYISVSKSSDIADIPEDEIKIYVHTHTKEGSDAGLVADFAYNKNGFSVYKVDLLTNYVIDDDDRLHFTSIKANDIAGHFVNLVSDFHITFMISKNVVGGSTVQQAGFEVIDGVPGALLNNYYALIRQKVTITFGWQLDDVLYNSINVAYTKKQYKTYPTDIPAVYTTDVYETDADGSYKVEIDPDTGKPKLFIKHALNSPKVDEHGNLIYLHRKGDLYLDENLEPVEVTNRNLIYEVSALQVDARSYFSEYPKDKEFITKLPRQLEDYFDKVRMITNQILERTSLYFKPVKSIGTAKYGIGDGFTLTENLALSFKAKYYVKPFVTQDPDLQSTIINTSIKEIEKAILSKSISCTDIFSQIKNMLSDYILQIDILGINGNVTLQSLVVLDTHVQPTLSKKITLSKDNVLYLAPQLSIEFITSDAERTTDNRK